VDGNETDAYAFLSVLNLQEHKDPTSIRKLIEYINSKATSSGALAPLADLLSKPEIPPIGLVLTERLINVPAEVIPPMYTMLLEEIEWAVEDGEPYTFTHYLILSKTYTEVASKLDAEDDRPTKKQKKRTDKAETFYFHPEDEVFHRHTLCHGGFAYTTKQDDGISDSKRAFQELGIKPQGHMMLIEAGKFKDAVKDVAEYMKPPT